MIFFFAVSIGLYVFLKSSYVEDKLYFWSMFLL